MSIIIVTKQKSDGERLRRLLSEHNNLFSSIPCFTKEDVEKNVFKIKNCKYLYSTWDMPFFSEDEVKKFFPSLRAIFYAAGSVKYFAEPFLKSGVKVYSSAKANGIPVAEFVVAQIVLANKGYFQAQYANKSFLWRWAFKQARKYTEKRPGNYGSKVGLIGCGSVGTEVVRLLKQYQLEVLIHDPYVSQMRCQELGVQSVSMETIFESCNVISNHLPDIPSTQGVINYNLLNRMKDYTTFINTGRGAQVVEVDLARLLRKRPSICALLDVSRHEPPFPWSPLLRRKNLFLSPHIAGSAGNEITRMVEYALMAYDDFINQRPSDLEVTLEMLNKTA